MDRAAAKAARMAPSEAAINSHAAQIKARQAAAAAADAVEAANRSAAILENAILQAGLAAEQADAALRDVSPAASAAMRAALMVGAAQQVAEQAAEKAIEAAARAEEAARQLELAQPDTPFEHCLRACSTVLYPHLGMPTRRALRLVCRSARQAVDDNVQGLRVKSTGAFDSAVVRASHWRDAKQLQAYGLFALPSPLPAKLSTVMLQGCRFSMRDAETLLAIAPTLTNLHLCDNALGFDPISPMLKPMTSTQSADGGPPGSPWTYALQRLTALRCLQLNVGFCEGSTLSLAPAWGALTGLTELEIGLSCGTWPAQELHAALSAVGGLSQLQVLRFSLPASVENARLLGASLVRLPQLRVLDLSYGDWGHKLQGTREDLLPRPVADMAITALAPALATLTGLQELVLTCSSLGPGVAALPKQLTGLQRLELTLSGLGSYGAETAALLRSLPNLTSLGLASNSFDADDVRKVFSAVALLTGLQRLSIDGSDLWGDGVQAVSALVALTQLRSLRIDAKTRGPEVLSVLRQLTWLEELYLSLGKKSRGTDARHSLTELLRCLPRLRCLILISPVVSNGSASHLGQALSQLTSLQRLFLMCPQLGAKGMLRMLPHLRHLAGLESLTIEGSSGMADLKLADNKRALAASLCQLSGLTRLNRLHVGEARFNSKDERVARDHLMLLDTFPRLSEDNLAF